MSRIGKKLVEIPAGVNVSINGRTITVKSPKYELKLEFHPEVLVSVEGNMIKVSIKDDLKRLYPVWGLTRALIANMVEGVTKGYEERLELVGVGYRAKQNDPIGVTLSVWFSKPVEFKAPDGVEIQVLDQQTIIIKGPDKHLVGFTAAKIRKVRPPEPYKGKGIRYSGEVVRRKAGKAGKAVGAGAAK